MDAIELRCFASFASEEWWRWPSLATSMFQLGPPIVMLFHMPAFEMWRSVGVHGGPQSLALCGLRGGGDPPRLGAPSWIFLSLHHASYFSFISWKYMTSGLFSWCKLFLIAQSLIISLCSKSGLANLSCTAGIKLPQHRYQFLLNKKNCLDHIGTFLKL